MTCSGSDRKANSLIKMYRLHKNSLIKMYGKRKKSHIGFNVGAGLEYDLSKSLSIFAFHIIFASLFTILILASS